MMKAVLTALFIGIMIYAIGAGSASPKERDRARRQTARRREGPQVVGFACAKCGERIIFDAEARPCSDCGKPVHLACMPHPHDDGKTPYRD